MQITSLADLLDLQDIDLQLDRLLEQRQSLPELADYRDTDEQLKAVRADLEAKSGRLRELELELDKSQGELDLMEIKLQEQETRLFAGGMSSRETEHMRLAVESLKGQRGTLEESILHLLDDVDPVKDDVARLAKEVSDLESTKSTLEEAIKKQWSKIDAEIARKEIRKSEAAEPIEDELLELYDKLRQIKEGVAVAGFDHGVCGGCHMALSPAEEQEAFAAELPRCVHCRRILVA